VLDLAKYQKQEQDRQYRIYPHEADEREKRTAGGHARRRSLRGSEDAIDQPRLAADLGGDPAAVVAMYGNGSASMSVHSIGCDV